MLIDAYSARPPDKTRLCPSCRSEISFFATKCRFCGEEVGRPREESRQLTITELGGEGKSTQYAPSGNVLEALELFRAEILGEKTGAEQSRGAVAGQKTDPITGLPELDARSQALASMFLPTLPRKAPPPRKPLWRKNVYIFGAFVCTVMVLFVLVLQASGMIRGYLNKQNTVPEDKYINQAPGIIEAGGDLVDALAASIQALRRRNTPENQRIAEEVRREIEKRIEELLNADPWRPEYLADASSLANRGAPVDPLNDVLQALQDEVNGDSAAYAIMCTGISVADGVPKTVFTGGDSPEAKKGNDLVVGRFAIVKIMQDRVVVEDRDRLTRSKTYRRLIFPLGLPVTSGR